MLAVRLTVFKYYTLFISSIALDGEIINPYSCCVKKGLVYIAITEPFSRQPFSCFKCIKSNTCVLYNMRLVSFNIYIFLTCFNSF